jgi:hypothetical protein
LPRKPRVDKKVRAFSTRAIAWGMLEDVRRVFLTGHSRRKANHEIAQGPCSQTTKEAKTSSRAKSKNRSSRCQEMTTA